MNSVFPFILKCVSTVVRGWIKSFYTHSVTNLCILYALLPLSLLICFILFWGICCPFLLSCHVELVFHLSTFVHDLNIIGFGRLSNAPLVLQEHGSRESWRL